LPCFQASKGEFIHENRTGGSRHVAALEALTMKTIITINSRPLRRALCTLLLGIAVLWAMPRSARAQLRYVGCNYFVGEYNATTGAAINASLITVTYPDLYAPCALALSGNTLFVADSDSDLAL
jgi:hypothetical protein